MAIPMPPIESLPAWQLGLTGAGAAVVGGIVLLWGRLVHRVVLMIAMAALAYCASPVLAAWTHLAPVVARGAAVLAAMILALVLARLIWAYLAGMAAAAAMAWVVLPSCLGEVADHPWPAFPTGIEGLADWLAQAGGQLQAILLIQWQGRQLWLLAAAGAAAIIPFLLLLIRPRLGAIFMTCLLGGAATVAGLALIAGAVRVSALRAAWQNWPILAGMLGTLLLGGLVFQYYGAVQAEKARKEQAEKKSDKPTDDKGQSRKPENADK